MLKILLYGGCHAQILRDLIGEIFDDVDTELVVNFELIAAGRSFPDELLDRCDVLIFSPIENKGIFNTEHLLDRCAGRPIRTICFPWMEWHGYCPGATKGIFKGRFQWFYPKLLEIAKGYNSFDDFVDRVVTRFPDDELIDTTFARSSRRLAEAERRHDMAVTISKHIDAHHRVSRLFLISDHPSLSLYLHVLAQIAALLDLRMPDEDLELRLPEPQWRWRTPIFPRVAARLNLAFDDTRWVDDELVAGHSFDLETYLKLYFYRDSVILGPAGNGDEAEMDQTIRIVASPLGQDDDGGRTYLCRERLAGASIPLHSDATFRIDPRQWSSTWQF